LLQRALQFIQMRFVEVERYAEFRLAAPQLEGLRNNRRHCIHGFAQLPDVLGSEIAFAAQGALGVLQQPRYAIVDALECSLQVVVHHALHLPLLELLEFSGIAGGFCAKPECASLEMRRRCVGSDGPVFRSAFAHAERMRVNIPISSCIFSREAVMLACRIRTRPTV
jgi:hypothetical protein